MKSIPRKQPTLIARLMDTFGHRRDAEFYLDLFTAQRPESFALIVVEEDVVSHDLDAFTVDLRYLRELGLFPVVVFHSSTLIWDSLDYHAYFKKMGLKVTRVNQKAWADDIIESIKNKTIPLAHVATHGDPVPMLVSMANALKSKKLIFLNPMGALQETDTGVIELLRIDDVALYDSRLSRADFALLTQCRDIVLHASHRMHIAITAPGNLLRELFTVKGAGTLIYKGSKIESYPSLAGLDLERLRTLLESSFDKALKRPLSEQAMGRVYLEAGYRGAAFVRAVGSMAYLSKFAVGLKARGVGVGRDLWQRLTEDYPRLFWRADPNNFIASWYATQCHGMQKGKRWNVYWIGLAGADILGAIEYATSQEEDFI